MGPINVVPTNPVIDNNQTTVATITTTFKIVLMGAAIGMY
jgi:hypothetical protein